MNMKELAALCKVSVATVSYALRDDERISKAVRERIQATAEKHNYRANSQSSALVRYRDQSKQPIQTPNVGILYVHPKTSRRTQLIQPHIKSFHQNITPYGYTVKEFFLGDDSNATESLLKELRAAETQGLVLAWGDWKGRLKDFPWNEYSVVSAERNEIHPALDRVSMNHFNATDEAFHQLERLGVERIGLVCHDDLPIRVRKNIVGAYLMNVQAHETWIDNIQPYFYRLGESPEAFLKWFQENQLDAVLAHRQIPHDFFEQAGLQFPRDAQYAVIEMDAFTLDDASGLRMNDDMGRVLAETIAGKLHYDEKVDLQATGNLILVDGVWQDGVTTVSKKA